MQVTSTATIVLSSTGLVMVPIHKREPETLAEARETLAAAISAAAGRRSPLLLDMQAAPPLAMEVRRLYLNQGLSEHFSALALLVEDSVLGRMMGNVYAALVRTGLPSNVFTNESGAREWLIQYTV